eukprot:5366134-Pyramimonas_sp.AAC.1
MGKRCACAKRPSTVHFDPSGLAKKLEHLAQWTQRSLGFVWDGSDYPQGRGRPADLHSLDAHASVLSVLLDVAPTGFPSQPDLRTMFMKLHEDHGVFPDLSERHLYKRATEASENWRIMMRHVYDMAKNKDRSVVEESPAVADLPKKATLPDEEAGEGVEADVDSDGAHEPESKTTGNQNKQMPNLGP